MKKICLIGGGHGTSRLIKGFKDKNVKIDVIVTSCDNGGHSGELIKEFNVPALGDLRMVLESILEKPLNDFFAYRFKNLHGKSNVSLGNLMLLSMILENNNDVNKMLEIVNSSIDSKYCLHLANNEYVNLMGKDYDDNLIIGEANIGNINNIKEVYLDNDGEVNDSVIDAINNADVIVFSFGSFFTSLIATISHYKIKEAIKTSKAKLIYIPNLVNQMETKDYSLENYVDYLEDMLERKLDKVIISNSKIKRKYIKRYSKVNKKIVSSNQLRIYYSYYPLLEIESEKLRHNVAYLAQIITSE